MKIYIGCSLTHAPAAFRERVETVKHNIRTDGFEVLDFVGLEQGTEKDVYVHDLACVDTCDVFIALCDYPAIGLGFEIERALEVAQKPTLLLASQDALVTRLLLGAALVHPLATLYRYTDDEHLLRLIRTWIKTFDENEISKGAIGE